MLRSLNLKGEEAPASEEDICLFYSLSVSASPHFQDLKHEEISNGAFLTNSNYIGHGVCIVVPGRSGIPKWIRTQSEARQTMMSLPHNWYENNDFLGVAVCFVYVPLDACVDTAEDGFAHTSKNQSGDEALNESDDLLEAEPSISTDLGCQLSFYDRCGFSPQCVRHLSFRTTCKCYHDGGVSDQMWVIFYPKAAFRESCRTNGFTSLVASFLDSCNHFEVLKCGLEPIYAQYPIVQTDDVDASCLECQTNVEYRKICLNGQIIDQLPIEVASECDTLCLRECKNLESLPTGIWELKSLKSLFCSDCSQLRCLPEIVENMENLRELHLNGTAITELPSSIVQLNRLEVLNLDSCKNLVTLPESICNLNFLEHLDVSFCSKLHRLPQNLGRLQSLKSLYADGLNSTCCRLLSLSGLCSLKWLFLPASELMQGVILSDICWLYSLEVLDLSFCNIGEGGILPEICNLSSLRELFLVGNPFRSIPTGIDRLSMLRLLDLSHCSELRQIPGLPSSLRVLDVHKCTWLETSSDLLWSSLFNCFKSVIQDLECRIYPAEKRFARVSLIISGSSGIPKWINHHKIGAKVVAKLPPNWYKNNDLLGFVLYCLYDPLDNESGERLGNHGTYFNYDLTLHGPEIHLVDELQYYFSSCCGDDAPKMWIIYYPKVDIQKKYHSNKWRQLTASFSVFIHGKAMKMEECGIHLMYSRDHEENLGKAMIPTICSKCQQDVQSQRMLCLKGNAVNELPSIRVPLKLDSLCLRECKSLESLPSSICRFKSLRTLFCTGCSQLNSFPEILEDMENLRELHLSGTAIGELPASIQHLGLQWLNLANCNNLVILPESICNLSSLKILDVSFCTKLEKFPENLRSLQCLESLYASGLNLSMNCFSGIPAGIIQLSRLRVLDLSHCQRVRQVPELPPSLRYLDVHGWTCLEDLSSPLSLSLFKCFKSTIEEFECGSYLAKALRVVTSGNNGIPARKSQQKKGSQITIKLPMDWYKNTDFLGFALYCVFIPMACRQLHCKLNICGDQSECCHVDDVWFFCCPICGESSRMCVTYYPKVAIDHQYRSNKWRRLKASFHGFDGEPVEVKECGFHLLYTHDVINRDIPEDTSNDAQRSCDNTEATKRDHQTMIECNDELRSCDARSAAEDANSTAQTSYDRAQSTKRSS